jgi:spermidine/putrescine transport system substrate-binding protein
MRSEFDGLLRTPMGRRALLKYMGYASLLGGTGVLAACRRESGTGAGGNGGATSTPTSRPPIEQENGVLSIHEWAGYETKWIWRPYAQKGYPDPEFSFLTNTEGAIAKTQGGFYWDITHPETGYIQDYLNMGVIQPWDTSLIPNFADLNPVLQQHGNIDGQQYAPVLDWGYSGVLIRTDFVDPEINSYSYLFDDANAGHIGWFDTPWIIQQAAMVLGITEDAGFTLSDDELNEAKEFAISKAGNVYSIWVDYTQMWDDVQSGTLWATYSWPDTYVVLKDEVPVQYIRPKEGVLSWAEGLLLRADTENYYHAHEYADAWSSVETGQRLLEEWGYGHANLKVDLGRMDPDVVEVFGLDDPETNLAEPNSYFDRYQPDRDRYNRAWDEVKASIG